MDKVLTVIIKNNYGNKLVYPACENSKVFARIAKSTTLTEYTIDEIKKLGYHFVVKSEAYTI
jgi:hypothetical protein